MKSAEQELRERLTRQPTDVLLKMLGGPAGEYREEALAIAREELAKRHIPDEELETTLEEPEAPRWTPAVSTYGELIHELRERFPKLKPIKRPPFLHFAALGITPPFFGGGEVDVETGTYLLTLGVTFYRFPIFFLGSYRVLDSSIGEGQVISLNLDSPRDERDAIVRYCSRKSRWHFIGKEPLSSALIAWNVLVISIPFVMFLTTLLAS